MAINCGAIPEQLIESTLFGHEKGAFTGATHKALGKFREAEGGTIFLDEVGELPMEAQVKLLRVLQQKEVEPVGASANVKVNVRIISATNRDLNTMVKEGLFREDLFFRLHVLPVTIPPLRKRQQDIKMLAEFFLNRFSVQDMVAEKQLSPDAVQYLLHGAWPGNVRELENLMRRALVLCDGALITAQDLEALQHGMQVAVVGDVELAKTQGPSLALMQQNGFKSLQQIETEAIQAALDFYKGNITLAADALQMAKSTFYRKIKDAKIDV